MQAGETIAVADNGEVVAVLVPPPGRPDALLRVRRATVRGGFSTLPRTPIGHPVQDDLDVIRGDP